MESHQILNGKVQFYRRGDSRIWQCAASVGGKQRRATTKRDSLSLATEFAEDWYLGLRGKDKAGILLSERSFAQAAAQFLREYEIITEGERSKKWTTAMRSGCAFTCYHSSASYMDLHRFGSGDLSIIMPP